MSTDADSSVGMTIKEMVTELFADMKVIRPMVEALDGAHMPERVSALETDKVQRDVLAPSLAQSIQTAHDNMALLLQDKRDRDSQSRAVSRIAGVSNKAIVVILGVGELALGIVVVAIKK